MARSLDEYLCAAKSLAAPAAWEASDCQNLAPHLFGEHFAPLHLVATAARAESRSVPAWAEIGKLVAALGDRPVENLLEGESAGVLKQIRQLAAGLSAIAELACQWHETRTLDGAAFADAAASFNAAWPDICFRTGHPLLPLDSELAEQVDRIAVPPDTGGFWIAWDLLDRVVHPYTKMHPYEGSYPPEKLRQAQTPVLLADRYRPIGDVAMLTVELIGDGNSGFCPDPLYMGLICLSNSNDRQKNLQRSMQDVWKRSGLERGRWRGRWRITAYERWGTAQHLPPLDYRVLEGRSFEASTLAALWAACGNIPEQVTRGNVAPSLELDRAVAVSACLDPGQAAGLADIRLETVDEAPKKLEAARRCELDTVLLAEDRVLRGLAVQGLGTMGEVFEQLLVLNQLVRAHQFRVRQQWLAQWKSGTGRAPWDEGADPEAEAGVGPSRPGAVS